MSQAATFHLTYPLPGVESCERARLDSRSFPGLLPGDCPNGWLAMLTAYFDDSGTHDDSNVVLVAGIVGTEWQLSSLDRLWKSHIEQPLCGRKERLRRFHATECHDSRGEFAGWTRTETDYCFHQLHDVLIESHGGHGSSPLFPSGSHNCRLSLQCRWRVRWRG
jgi:hypothetical protein